MSAEVKYCFDTDEVEEAARSMADIKVRRLPVLDAKKRLVGIVSLGDIALAEGSDPAGEALCCDFRTGRGRRIGRNFHGRRGPARRIFSDYLGAGAVLE